jgi:hypothetical protein
VHLLVKKLKINVKMHGEHNVKGNLTVCLWITNTTFRRQDRLTHLGLAQAVLKLWAFSLTATSPARPSWVVAAKGAGGGSRSVFIFNTRRQTTVHKVNEMIPTRHDTTRQDTTRHDKTRLVYKRLAQRNCHTTHTYCYSSWTKTYCPLREENIGHHWLEQK